MDKDEGSGRKFLRNRSFYEAQEILLDHLLSMNMKPSDDRAEQLLNDLIRVLSEPQKQCDSSYSTDGTTDASYLVLEFLEQLVPNLLDYELIKLTLDPFILFLVRRDDICKEINKILLRWIKKLESRLEFRQWYISWLLRYNKQVISCDNINTWTHAFEFAAAIEEDSFLKHQLKLLAIKARSLDESNTAPHQIDVDLQEDQKRIDTPKDLLKFYWAQADQLSPFTLLCARKFQAIAHSNKTSSVSTTCRVILKWGRFLKRSFFEPFTRDLIALQALDGSIESLQLSPILEKAIPSEGTRFVEYGEKALIKRREHLLSKYKMDTKCLHNFIKIVCDILQDSVKKPSTCTLIEAMELELNVSEIVRDLTFAPSYLYLFILAVLEKIMTIHRENGTLLTEQTASMLFEMILYTEDESNCLDLLGFLLSNIGSIKLAKEMKTTNSLEKTINTLKSALQLVQGSHKCRVKYWCIKLLIQLIYLVSPPKTSDTLEI